MTTLEKLEELIYHGFKESERRFRETDQRFKVSIQEFDRRFQETERLIDKNAGQLVALKTEVRGLTKSLGLFAESMVHPSVTELFGQRGFLLSDLALRSRAQRNGEMMEVDVLGAGREAVVAVEVKLRLEQSDVKEFLKRLPRFFEFFPRYRGLQLYGAVAGMSIDQDVPRYAYKQGLFVLAPSGENMQILNDEKFVPRVFGETGKKKTRKRK